MQPGLSETQEQPRNEVTRTFHRREVLWQVTVPFGVGVLLILALAGGVFFTGARDTSLWADVSTIWLLLPVIVLALIPLVLLVLLIYGVTWLVTHLPVYTFIVQQAFRQVDSRVQEIADRAVEPALRVRSSLAALRALSAAGRPDKLKKG